MLTLSRSCCTLCLRSEGVAVLYAYAQKELLYSAIDIVIMIHITIVTVVQYFNYIFKVDTFVIIRHIIISMCIVQ